MICGEQQDQLARTIHADYLGLTQGTASRSDAYKTAWSELERGRARRQPRPGRPPSLQATLQGDISRIDDSSVPEFLAMTEHQRWAAHRYLNG